MNRKIVITAMAAGMLSFILLAPLSAQSLDLGERVETAELSSTANCQSASTRIPALTQKYTDSKNLYTGRYTSFLDKLKNLERYLAQEGLEPSELYEEILFLEREIEEFESIMDQVVRQLDEAKNLACNGSEEDYKSLVIDAKVNSAQAKEISININSYLSTQIYTVLTELKKVK